MTQSINSVLEFWFGELDQQGFSAAEQHAMWFKSSAETDRHCTTQFGDLVTMAIDNRLERWAQSDSGLIALIVLLDQMTRNIYRGTSQAFSGDTLALELSQRTISANRHSRLPSIHQVFLYLPLEHSENIETQDHCVKLFEALEMAKGPQAIAGFSRYAIAHRDVITQFGRFPHRNAILGRESTAAELEYLATHGGF